MRIRNLYEVAVAPGERKGFSLRLKKLENLQMKIADMQNTITNLKGTSIPDVLKKQMDDLINSASMEKEKLYSEIDSVEGRNKTINGIPGNILKLLKGIEKNAPTIMNAYRNTGKFLYRGIKSDDDALYGRPFDERRPKDSNADLNIILNKALNDAGFVARRDNTSFTSGTYSQANNYGTVYIFFPKDGFNFHYSKSIKDLVMGSDKLSLLLDTELVNKIKQILSTNWNELDHYFTSASSSSDFLSGYTYQSDLRGIQKAVADGKLPPEFAKFKTIDDFVDPAKVVSQMQYDQSDLDGAITSGHEVMVTGPYYALRADKFKDYIEKYISTTGDDSVDITPDTSNEKTELDAKINSMLGQKPDGFLIGDWIQHKYDSNIKGEVVNNFYTNEFLLVKTYEGKLELVKNSNANKIDAPTVPQYTVGDKLYVRSKGTGYSKFNNKYGKVSAVDGAMVTITYGSYNDTISVPAMLTEPAPKYDSKNPSVGDTVHITIGDLKGEYGVITYVSSYGSVDVDFDGETETVSTGDFEVVDPITKPVDSGQSKFEVGDFVEITGSNWNTFVGIVKTPGKITTRVQIMNGDDGSGQPESTKIQTKSMNKITKEEFDARSLKYGDIVTVTGGQHAGKTGKITYFYSTGTVEILKTGGGYIEANIGEINRSSDLAVDNAPNDNTLNDNIEADDKVTITSGLYKGLTGIAKTVSASAIVSVELVNQTVNVNKLDLKKENKNAAISKNTVDVGDNIKVISGSDVGKTGVITKLGKGGTYIKLDDGSNEVSYVFNTSIEKVDSFDDDLIDLDDIDFETFDEPAPTKAQKTTFDVNALPFMVGDTVNASNPKANSNLWVVKKIENDGVTIKRIKGGYEIKKTFDQFYKANPNYAPTSTQPVASAKFKIDDTVEVITGNFKDFTGTVSDIEESQTGDATYTVKINIFGKDTLLPFLEAELKKSKSERTKPTSSTNLTKQKDVKDLIAKGKASGTITYAELNDVFPAGEVDSEQIADVMDMISELGIEIVDETGLFQPSGDTPEQLLATVAQPERKQGLLDVFKDPIAKLYIKNAVEGKYMSNDILIELVGLAGYDKYVDFIQPYLELKGVTFG